LVHVDAEYDFGLLSVLGRESAGALSFWPEDETPFEVPFKYDALSTAEFEAWKEYAHQLPLQFSGRTIRLSLAGAQSKTALYFDEEDNPFIPENGAPTTHILKPRIQGCHPSSVFVELLTMRIAQSVLGEDRVPYTDLWNNCYRIRRFDRPNEGAGIKRLHQEDFCLALGRMPTQKYEMGSTQERLLRPCFQLIDKLGDAELIRSPAIERQRLLDQVIVNVLLHNPDAHLKNYSFLYQDDGLLEISPLYDSLCTRNLTFEADNGPGWVNKTEPAMHTRDLSLRIGNAQQINHVTLEDWEYFAQECGFTKAFIRRRLKLQSERVSDRLESVVESVLEEIPIAGQAAETVVEGVSRQVRAITPS